MTAISLVKAAHDAVKQHVKPGDIVIDATVGNGHDTLFLAELVSSNGLVYGFDIQPQAIKTTQAKLQNSPYTANVVLFEQSHVKLVELIPAKHHAHIQAIMFNLGYLPGSDKIIKTSAQSTITALAQALQLLSPNGIISIVAYPGHEGGDIENDAVRYWCETLDKQFYQLVRTKADNTLKPGPELFVIKKTRMITRV